MRNEAIEHNERGNKFFLGRNINNKNNKYLKNKKNYNLFLNPISLNALYVCMYVSIGYLKNKRSNFFQIMHLEVFHNKESIGIGLNFMKIRFCKFSKLSHLI